MKKKYFRSFINLFKHLQHAGLIIAGDFYKPGVEQKTKEISEVVDKFIAQAPILLQNVLDETESNLYSISKDDRESYATGILKSFAPFAPYLNYAREGEIIDRSEGQIIHIINEKHQRVLNSCHKLILEYELKYTEHFDRLTRPQQYIILCYRTYRDFFNQLISICLNFGINIIEIQRKNGFQVWHGDDVHSIEKNEKISNNTDNLSQDTMRDKIATAFGWMTGIDPRKHKVILNEPDFNRLLDWITYYFEHDFSLPEVSAPIKSINTNKGNVVYTFMKFFKDEYPSHTRPDSLFELIKCCFHEYREDKIENLKKTKEPPHYSELIRKNK